MNYLKLTRFLGCLMIAIVLFHGIHTSAQTPGSLDTSFGVASNVGLSNSLSATAIQSDGKVVVGGAFISYNGINRNYIARLNADGSLDTSFDSSSGANSNVSSIAIQSDGKVIIAGSFTTYNGVSRSRIARINTDGSLDTSFVVGAGADNTINSIAIQSDGKIIIGGNFTTYSGVARSRIARLNADGSLDTSFIIGGGANNNVNVVAIQSDGKIIIGGSFTSYAGTTRNRLARINTGGSLDTSFSGGVMSDNTVNTLTLQSDEKIIIGGSFTSYGGGLRNRVARINTGGSLDTSFDPGSGPNSNITSIAMYSGDKILIGGGFTTYSGINKQHIALLNNNGSLDTSFINSGAGPSSTVNSISIQADSKIIIGGSFVSISGLLFGSIARLDTNGSVDTSFNPGGGFIADMNSIAIQNNGKIIIAGNFTTYSGISTNRIARLNSDGSLDTSFNIGGSGANNIINAMKLQSDGKIIIAGNFTNYNGTTRNRIARLNSDGSLDTSFDPGAGSDNIIRTMIIQPDGKILIGGAFFNYNGNGSSRIARINSDGSFDSSFIVGGGANNTVWAIAMQSDGKILIGGDFTSYNGTTRNRIVRINTGGSLDSSFVIGVGADNTINAIAIQSDGKIIIAGNFTNYNSTSRNRIARINTGGSSDTLFNPSAGFNGAPQAIIIQSDGRILIGGVFTTYNGVSRNRIARINTGGSLDTSFDPGAGSNGLILSMAEQSDGKILIGGQFILYNGIRKNFVARIYGDIVSCLGGIGTITFSSFGFCLQSAGRSVGNYIVDLLTNTTLPGVRSITGTNLGRSFRIPYKVAPTSGTSIPGQIIYVGNSINIPSISAEQTGEVYITPFKPIEIATGGMIQPIR